MMLLLSCLVRTDGSLHCVVHEHGYCHRSSTSRHRSQMAGYFNHLIVVDISHKPLTRLFGRVWDGVDAAINDNCTRLHPVPLHHLCPSNGNHKYISCAAN